jgi:hypothetical protein
MREAYLSTMNLLAGDMGVLRLRDAMLWHVASWGDRKFPMRAD